MALGLSFAANLQPNLVLMPSPMVCRVATQRTGTVGTFSLTGTPAGALQWTLQGGPAGGAVTLVPQAGTQTATLQFSNIPQRTAPYIMIVSVTDGTTLVQSSVAIVARPGLQVLQQTVDSRITGSGPWTVSGNAYDSTLPSMQFQAMAGSTVLTNAQFVAPDSANLLPGLTFQLTQGGAAVLAVAQPSQSGTGGIAVTSQTEPIAFQVYEPNTLYDSPSNAYTVNVTYALSAASVGSLKAGLGGTYDPDTNDIFLNLDLFYQGGKAQSYDIAWSVSSGATGSWSGGAPGTHTSSVAWVPSGSATQSVTFTATITDPAHMTNPLVLTAGPFKVAPEGSWVGTTALQVELPQGSVATQDRGKTAWIAVALPDLQSTETAQVTLSLSSLPTAQPDDPAAQTYTVAAGAAGLAFFPFSIPASSPSGQMWQAKITVVASTATTARSGFGQLLLVSNGAPQLVVTSSSTSISATAGVAINPIPVSVLAWTQKPVTVAGLLAMDSATLAKFLSSTPNTTNSTSVTVTNATLALASAPTGLSCADGQVSGTISQTGFFGCTIQASATGYQTGSSSELAITVGGSSPFVTVDWQSPAFSFSGGNLLLNWGTTGTPTGLQLHESSVTTAPNVVLSWATGSGQMPTQLSMPLTGTESFLLVASNALGSVYSQPIVVQPATSSTSSLPISPVTATLDAEGTLVMTWTPPAVDNISYSYWTVWAETATNSLPFALPSQSGHPGSSFQAADGSGPGSTYTYTTSLGSAGSGHLSLQMQAFGPNSVTSALWDSYNAFPAPQGAYLSKTTASISEPFTVFLEAITAQGAGSAGDSWWIEIQNLTSLGAPSGLPIRTNALPLSITAVPMSLPARMVGSNTVTAYISKTYVNSDKTLITLVRSFKVALPLVISNGVYQGNPLASAPPAEFSVAGSDGVVPPPDNYMVIAPALVRDESTHEIKLLLATARGASASSQFGTMAADVFPLQGRPHTLDPLDVQIVLSTATSVPQPLLITTTGLEDAVAGQPVTPFQLQATGGQAPYQWFAKNLPQGMYLSRDGIVTGAPIGVGNFQVLVSVQDSQDSPYLTNATLALLVSKSDITISGVLDGLGNAVANLPAAHVGTYYTAGVQAKLGIEPYTWSLLAGSLPPGLSLNPVTGAITGWSSTNATLDAAGLTYSPTFEVTDAVGATAARSFPMTLLPMALTLGLPDQSLLTQGVDTQVCVPVTGGAPPYALATPTLPDGFSAPTMINGIIKIVFPRTFVPPTPASGNPQVSFSLTVSDSDQTQITHTYTFTITPASSMATWKDAHFPTKIGGLLGGGPLPSGVAGGPTPMADGVNAVSFDGLNNGDTVTLSVVPCMGGAPLSGVVLDAPNSSPVQVSLNDLSGVSSGSNQEAMARVTVSDSAGLAYEQATREYSIGSLVYTNSECTFQVITVNPLPVALYESFAFDPQCPARNASSPTITFDQVTLASSSQLPEGVSLDSATGMLYGAAQVQPASGATTILNYFMGGIQVAALTVVWNIIPADLVVTPSTTIPGAAGTGYPTVQVGQPYHATLSVANATQNGLTSVSVIHGSLPQGVTMVIVQGNSGTNQPPTIVFGGAPGESGTFDPYIKVVDSNPLRSGLFKVRIVVNASRLLSLVTESIPSMVSGLTYATSLVATGGLAPYTWSISPDSAYALPVGITLNASTGVLSGMTTVSGLVNEPITFLVTDANGTSKTRVILINANPSSGLEILTAGLPAGVVGGAYEAPLQAFGGIPDSNGHYTWSMVPASPAGLALDATTGVISGIPTEVFSGTVTITVTDAMVPTPATFTASPMTLTIGASGTPVISATLPVGYLGHAYGSPNTGSLIPTGNCGSMSSAAPGFSWAQAHTLTLGGAQFMVTVGGFRRPVTGSLYALSGLRPAQPAGPLYFNPATTSNGMPIGYWGVMSGSVDPTATNHMMAASAPVSDKEIIVIGGVANDQCLTQDLGTSLNQATLLAFTATVDGTGKVIPSPNATAYSRTQGSDTIVSGAWPVPTDPTITRRYGASATQLATDLVFMCGGISRAVPSPSTPGTPGLRDDLTPDGDGMHHSQYAYVLQLTRTGGVAGTGTPSAATWTKLTPMPIPLAFHRALTLADGRVMVLGGIRDLQGESSAWTPSADGQGSNVCLIYNPSMDPLYPGSSAAAGSDPWTLDASLPVQVISPAACLLPNGQVFVGAPATSPYASRPANEVNGIPLSSVNCVLVYTPSTTPATAGSVGSWRVFTTTPASSGTDPRTQIPWGASAHVFGSGIVALVGGEQNLQGDGQTLQNPVTAPWNGSFDPNAIGLQGSLFNAALVGMDSAYNTLAVYSNPAVPAFYFSTNTTPLAGVYLTASGGVPPYRNWTVTPALPTGMRLDSDNGELTGTPTVATPSGQSYVFTVTDSRVPTPGVGSLAAPLQILDYTAPVWTTPVGTLNGSPWIEGPSGSPTPISVQLVAYAWTDETMTTSYSLTTSGTTLSCAVVAQSYQANSTSQLNPPGAPMLSGIGVNVSSSGLISGIPTVPGIYNFTIRASNSHLNIEGVTAQVSRPFSITVYGNLIMQMTGVWTAGLGSQTQNCTQNYAPGLKGSQTLSSPAADTLPGAYLGQPYSVTLRVLNGTAPYTWTQTGFTGGLASGGIAFSSSGATATLSSAAVTPVNGHSTETITPTVTVTDANGIVQKASFSLSFSEMPLTCTTTMPTAVVGQPYSQVIAITGGYGAYTVSNVTGVPSGMSLNTSTMVLSGTPVFADIGTPAITFHVVDSGVPTPLSSDLVTHVPIRASVFTWASGPQVANPGLWSSYDFHNSTSMLPLGICWDRFPSTGYSNTGVHAQDDAPWTVQVTGNFTTVNPSLSLGGLGSIYQGVTWVATLLQAPTVGGSSTAIFGISFSGSLALSTTTAFPLPCTLVDGGTADVGYLGGFFRASNAGQMPRPDASTEVFMTTSGVMNPSVYVG